VAKSTKVRFVLRVAREAFKRENDEILPFFCASSLAVRIEKGGRREQKKRIRGAVKSIAGARQGTFDVCIAR
jgi:hypothetical protein|tara:strand:- start:1866 stop:2081 length:216 start_codon:yes stop_codon:yes gene_type:complete